MSQIDWSEELRKIERQYDGLPPEPSADALRIRRDAERRAKQRKIDETAALGALARLVLVVALGVALDFWPYPRECGPGLFAYLGAAAVIVVGGLWAAVATWRGRLPGMHALAMAAMLWGTVLIGAQALPRVGYAKVDADHPPAWSCGVPAAAATTTTTSAAPPR